MEINQNTTFVFCSCTMTRPNKTRTHSTLQASTLLMMSCYILKMTVTPLSQSYTTTLVLLTRQGGRKYNLTIIWKFNGAGASEICVAQNSCIATDMRSIFYRHGMSDKSLNCFTIFWYGLRSSIPWAWSDLLN